MSGLIERWNEHFPDGFSKAHIMEVPTTKDNMLMLGADRRHISHALRPIRLNTKFDNRELRIDVVAEEGEFDGLVVAVSKIRTQPFDTLHIEAGEGKQVVEIGTKQNLRPLPTGKEEVARLGGDINSVVIFAAGHTILGGITPRPICKSPFSEDFVEPTVDEYYRWPGIQ